MTLFILNSFDFYYLLSIYFLNDPYITFTLAAPSSNAAANPIPVGRDRSPRRERSRERSPRGNSVFQVRVHTLFSCRLIILKTKWLVVRSSNKTFLKYIFPPTFQNQLFKIQDYNKWH